MAPSSPNLLYVGTGSEHAAGIGLLKSTDGGETWQFPANVIAFRFFRISVHPTNPRELVAASVWKTQDGGDSWTALPNTATDGSTFDSLVNVTVAKSNSSVGSGRHEFRSGG